jgi:hypothetical protein
MRSVRWSGEALLHVNPNLPLLDRPTMVRRLCIVVGATLVVCATLAPKLRNAISGTELAFMSSQKRLVGPRSVDSQCCGMRPGIQGVVATWPAINQFEKLLLCVWRAAGTVVRAWPRSWLVAVAQNSFLII